MYTYPDVWVCLYNTFGCDEQGVEKQCVESAELTDGGNAKATFHLGGEFEQTITAVGDVTDTVSMLVYFSPCMPNASVKY